ncbi:MAG: porin family protein [Prevotellaceae bacterium]|nr:porin family protein [Prevotellaceae bacterium]
MRRIICTIAIALSCLAVTLPAKAQLVQFGFKGGLNAEKLHWPDKSNRSSISGSMKQTRVGFSLGPAIEVNLPALPVGFDGAVVYCLRGSEKNKSAWKQSGFEVPLHVKYIYPLGGSTSVFVAAGPDLYLNLKQNVNNGKDRVAQLGVNVGAGFKFNKHYRLGVDYLIPVTESYGGEGKIYSGTKVKGWQVYTAYYF